MATSRRIFLTGLFGATATACFGQGVTAHKAAAQPRGKPSGLPFNARFTDVAAQAGLRAVTVYGESDRKQYIVETLGCGCAFLDFDNDGWLDIFLLSGTRFTDASSRRQQSPLQEQSRRHVHRCHRASGTAKDGMGLRRLRRRLQQ